MNYRYSIPAIMHGLGFGTGTGEAIPYYQDLSFKLNFPEKDAIFSVFGVGGLSTIDLLGHKIDSEEANDDLYGGIDVDIYNISNTGILGATYLHFFDPNTFFRNTLSVSGNEFIANLDTITRGSDLEVTSIDPYADNNFSQWTISYANEFNKKINRRNTFNAGLTVHRIYLDLTRDIFRLGDDVHSIHEEGNTTLLKAYWAWSHKLTSHITLNTGFHYLNLTLNKKSQAYEPRLGLKYNWNKQRSINLAYGRHSQTQGLTVYFNETILEDGSKITTNTDLGLTRSDHFLVGYEHFLLNNWRVKFESYYQKLFDVPVEKSPSTFSMLNSGVDFGLPLIDSLENKGTGRNIGIELTVERFLQKDWYVLSTTSIFDSKYKGSTGKKFNTAFNGNYVFNFLSGKEIKLKKFKSLLGDIRITYAGNRRFVPIDIEASEQMGTVQYMDHIPFENRYPHYFRMDVRFGFKVQMKKVSNEWSLDLQNITNRKNVLNDNYSFYTKDIYYAHQLGFWPMMKYRLLF